jgi:hypothetical protein
MTRSKQFAVTARSWRQDARRALAIGTVVAIAGGHSVLAQAGLSAAPMANAAVAATGVHAVEGSPLRSAVRRDAIEIAHGRLTLDVAGGTASRDRREGQATGSAQQRNWISRHPVLTGTMIGTGGTLAWQGVACRGRSCNFGRAALFGAGVGAYGGLIGSAIQKARAKEPVGLGTKIGLVAGAAGALFGGLFACYAVGGCGGVS